MPFSQVVTPLVTIMSSASDGQIVFHFFISFNPTLLAEVSTWKYSILNHVLPAHKKLDWDLWGDKFYFWWQMDNLLLSPQQTTGFNSRVKFLILVLSRTSLKSHRHRSDSKWLKPYLRTKNYKNKINGLYLIEQFNFYSHISAVHPKVYSTCNRYIN